MWSKIFIYSRKPGAAINAEYTGLVTICIKENRNMRKWSWLVVLIFALMVGCRAKTEQREFAGDLKNEVEAAWLEQKIYNVYDSYELIWVDVEDWNSLLYRPRYYGTYQDAVVVFQRCGMVGSDWEVEVAGQTLYSKNMFMIQVYQDGAFCELDEAYELGILTLEDIKDIAEYHVWFEHTYFSAWYDEIE